MTSTQQLTLPSEKFRLEEINMPDELAASLSGQTVAVDVLPEEPPLSLRFDLDNPPVCLPIVIDEDGVAWNDHWPVRVLYTDPDGQGWRLPRHWLSGGVFPGDRGRPLRGHARGELARKMVPADVVGHVRHRHPGRSGSGGRRHSRH
jgi:hypothetical protein